jgi:hypothetical protein
MNKVSGKEACQLAVNLIEEQLSVLPISIAMISACATAQNIEPLQIPNAIHLPRKRRPLKTASAGTAANVEAGSDFTFDVPAVDRALHENPLRRMHYQRVLVSNALLAVGFFLKEHGISATRTPEIQFLGHVCNAIVNANMFRIEAGYVPGASFDGLVIDSTLDGALLFGNGVTGGFMEFGDAVALLQWLAQYLRGMQDFVSGGDAG